MFIRCAYLFLAVLGCSASIFGKENKIIYLLSTPRSMSTMFVRMMDSRGDLIIYNEPTVLFYARENIAIYTPEWEFEDNFKVFADAKESIYSSQKKGDVFIKDMGFTSHQDLLKDQELMSNPSVYYVMLIRDPHEIALSIYGKVGKVIPNQSDMVGFKKLYEEYEVLKRVSPNGVKVIFAKDLCAKPQEVMEAYCKHLSIPFSEKAFSWKAKDETFDPRKAWHEQKNDHVTDHWHKRALETTGVGKRKAYAKDKMGNPTFQEIEDENDRKAFMGFYEENLVYYKKFLEVKEDFLLKEKGSKCL